MVVDERHAGEEGVIRSDIADVIDRSAAMAAYTFTAIRKAGEKGGVRLPDQLAEQPRRIHLYGSLALLARRVLVSLSPGPPLSAGAW